MKTISKLGIVSALVVGLNFSGSAQDRKNMSQQDWHEYSSCRHSVKFAKQYIADNTGQIDSAQKNLEMLIAQLTGGEVLDQIGKENLQKLITDLYLDKYRIEQRFEGKKAETEFLLTQCPD